MPPDKQDRHSKATRHGGRSSGRKVTSARRSADDSDYAPILDALRKLKAQSEDGFEGFFRDVLQSVSKRTLRLYKSGPQAGKDMVVDNDAGLPAVAIEAKRFGEKTRLPLDELKSKLREALETTSAIDLWAVVLSREMRQPDWSELEQIGAAHGVPILCLDWRSAPGSLPVIAALCAAAQHIALARLPGTIAPLLDRAAAHPDYEAIVEEVRHNLVSPAVGFDLARDAAARWLVDALTTEADSRQRLRNHVDVLSPQNPYVLRPIVEAALDAWWQSGAREHAVLLGDEGRGKTWAALAWAARRRDDTSPPMILAASAKDIGSGDAGEILGALLARALPLADRAALIRRLRRWMQPDGPRILLVVDGLNERWTHDWAEFVKLFDVGPWKGRVALLLTSRIAFWTDDLLKLQGAADKPILEIRVTDFSDGELDAMLPTFGLARKDFSPGLLNLIRIPRFARLAISLRDRLKDQEDLTVARLVLEDWRSRLEQRGASLRLDDEGLLEFVSGLAKDVLTDRDFSLSLADIHERLSADSGADLDHYRGAISDITEGHWLEPGDRPHRYKVSRRLLPFVIGLDLARSVEALDDEVAVDEVAAKYLEQLGGDDIAVAILRAATSISFARGKATRTARLVLLQRWLSLENFSPIDFAEMWPLIGLDPDLFCDFAEAHWRKHHVGRGEGEILAKGLANAAKWPRVESTLVSRLPHWAGAFGLDPIHWHFGKEVPKSDERIVRVKGRLTQWRAVQPEYHFLIETHLREGAKDHLPAAALSIMSFIPRAPFIETIITLAVARTLMGGGVDIEPLFWLLRRNTEDFEATEDAVLREVLLLKATGGDFAAGVADFLVDALGSVAAAQHRAVERGETNTEQPHSAGWPAMEESGAIVWSGGDRAKNLSDLARAEDLASFATDPRATLSPGDLQSVNAAAETIDARTASIRAYYGDHEPAALSFARWAPAALAGIVRSIYANLPGPGAESSGFAVHHLERVSLILGDAERRHLFQTGLDWLAAPPDKAAKDGRRERYPYQDMVVAGVVGRPSSDQADALRRLLPDFAFSAGLLRFLEPPVESDLKLIFDSLAGEQDERVLLSWLGYLRYYSHKHLPDNARLLIDLAGHPSSAVRGAAMHVLVVAGDPELGKAFADGGWMHRPGQERAEAMFGTSLLAEFGRHLPFADVAARILREGILHLVQERGCLDAEVRAAYEYVDTLLEEYIHPKKKTRTVYGQHFEADEIWRQIVRLDDKAIIAKTRQAAASRSMIGFLSDFPIHSLLEAILEVSPADGADIWKIVRDENRKVGFHNGNLDHLPFVQSPAPELADLRQYVLGLARNDNDLAEAAYFSLRSGHEPWLVEYIREGLIHRAVWRVAEALTLAGFLDDTEPAARLWKDHIDTLEIPAWLSHVRDGGRRCFRKNVHARHWFEQFFAAEGDDEAYAHNRLFEASLDRRYLLWGQKIVNGLHPAMPADRPRHIDASRDTRNDRLKKQADERKKTLYHTRTISYLAPWF